MNPLDTTRQFTRNSFFSHARITVAVILISAAAAMAFVARNGVFPQVVSTARPEPPPRPSQQEINRLSAEQGSAVVRDALTPSTPSLGSTGGTWTAQGPAPNTNGDVQNLAPNNEVSGAIHAVVAHPTDPNILYVGAVNGGIWRTANATAASPTWNPLTDLQQSLSIGALEIDPSNPQILLA